MFSFAQFWKRDFLNTCATFILTINLSCVYVGTEKTLKSDKLCLLFATNPLHISLLFLIQYIMIYCWNQRISPNLANNLVIYCLTLLYFSNSWAVKQRRYWLKIPIFYDIKPSNGTDTLEPCEQCVFHPSLVILVAFINAACGFVPHAFQANQIICQVFLICYQGVRVCYFPRVSNTKHTKKELVFTSHSWSQRQFLSLCC